MGLVDQLQQSAESDDAITVLRKAKRVSTKLKRKDISDWIDSELNGFDGSTEVPKYRKASASIHYNTNGYVPAGFGMVKSGIAPLPGFDNFTEVAIYDPLSAVLRWCDQITQGQGVFYPITGSAAESLRSRLRSDIPGLLERFTFLMRVSDSAIVDIPEQVKNTILYWACDLESAGIDGTEHSFTKDEVEQAKAVTFNLVNCNIDQLNDSGNNFKV